MLEGPFESFDEIREGIAGLERRLARGRPPGMPKRGDAVAEHAW
jgi:hypothetical protein